MQLETDNGEKGLLATTCVFVRTWISLCCLKSIRSTRPQCRHLHSEILHLLEPPAVSNYMKIYSNKAFARFVNFTKKKKISTFLWVWCLPSFLKYISHMRVQKFSIKWNFCVSDDGLKGRNLINMHPHDAAPASE